jgi:hypothetical protein
MKEARAIMKVRIRLHGRVEEKKPNLRTEWTLGIGVEKCIEEQAGLHVLASRNCIGGVEEELSISALACLSECALPRLVGLCLADSRCAGEWNCADTKDERSSTTHVSSLKKGRVSQSTASAERQASAGARDGVKGKGAISLRALRCMR